MHPAGEMAVGQEVQGKGMILGEDPGGGTIFPDYDTDKEC